MWKNAAQTEQTSYLRFLENEGSGLKLIKLSVKLEKSDLYFWNTLYR